MIQLSFEASGARDDVLQSVLASLLTERKRIERQHATDKTDPALPARIAQQFPAQETAVATILDALGAFIQAELLPVAETAPVAVSVTIVVHRAD